MPGPWAASTRFWAIAIGAGVLSGVMYLAAALNSLSALVFVYIAQLPLFLVGLSLGLTASAVAGTAAAGLVFVRFDWVFTLSFALAFLAPVLILVRQALLSRPGADGKTEWYPPGLLTGWLVSLGIALLLAGCLALQMAGGAEGVVRRFVTHMVDAVQSAMPRGAGEMDKSRAVELMAAYLPGMAIASLLAITTINGALAQGLLLRFGFNQRPSPDLAELEFPVVFIPIFAAAVVGGALLPGELGYALRNVAPVVLVGGVLAGLGVAHSAVRNLGGRSWVLAVIYVVAAAQLWPLLLLAAIGMAEPFLKLRRRIAGAV